MPLRNTGLVWRGKQSIQTKCIKLLLHPNGEEAITIYCGGDNDYEDEWLSAGEDGDGWGIRGTGTAGFKSLGDVRLSVNPIPSISFLLQGLYLYFRPSVSLSKELTKQWSHQTGGLE